MNTNDPIPTSTNTNTDSNLMAALSYVWILSVIILITKRNDHFVRWHARQGAVLFGISILGMVSTYFIFFLGPILCVGVIVLEVIGFSKAISGEWFAFPLLGRLSKEKGVFV